MNTETNISDRRILKDAGYDVRVERSTQRIFEDSEYEKLVATPSSFYIIEGIEEIKDRVTDTGALSHTVLVSHWFQKAPG